MEDCSSGANEESNVIMPRLSMSKCDDFTLAEGSSVDSDTSVSLANTSSIGGFPSGEGAGLDTPSTSLDTSLSVSSHDTSEDSVHKSARTVFSSESDICILVENGHTVGRAPKGTGAEVLTTKSVYMPMPDSLMVKTKSRSSEFSQLKYTKVRGDASEFAERGYSLRVTELKRRIEMFIVITMFNEDVDMFIKTWDSIIKNVAYLCSKRLSFVWGPTAWEKIAVCIVADGWRHLNPRTLCLLGAIGLYRDDLIASEPDPSVSAHMFEVTTQSRLMKMDGNYIAKQAPFPVQSLLFLKEKNTRKINSHRWFFDAFCGCAQPRLCAMLDVGTRLGICSIYEVWKAFYLNPKIGGVCGELCVDTNGKSSKLVNLLVAAQNFEYNSSNIFDKPIESLFGYVNVLPGAFSIYRYEALRSSSPNQHTPLERYFSGDLTYKKNFAKASGLKKANTYLAEDRVLGFEVISNRSNEWILGFVKGAKAYTDVPETVAEFLSQRRRWMNGSFFASLYVISNAPDIFKTKHSIPRKLSIFGVIIYNTIDMLMCWLQPSNCYIAFYYLNNRLLEQTPLSKMSTRYILFSIVNYAYLFSLFVALVTSLSIRPHGSRFMYRACMFVFSAIVLLLIMLCAFFMSYGIYAKIYGLFRGSFRNFFTGNDGSLSSRKKFEYIVTDIELVTVMLCLVHVLCCLVYGHLSHIFTSFIQYILLLPSRTNVLMVYAYCNIHDTTWGTKGLSEKKDDRSFDASTSSNPATHIRDSALILDEGEHCQPSTFLTLLNKKDNNPNHRDSVSTYDFQNDYPLLFRAKVVIPWILSNVVFSVLLVNGGLLLFSNPDPSFALMKIHYYLVFILWIFVIISFLKTLGSIAYHLILAKADIVNKIRS